jgi:hypothetical protein
MHVLVPKVWSRVGLGFHERVPSKLSPHGRVMLPQWEGFLQVLCSGYYYTRLRNADNGSSTQYVRRAYAKERQKERDMGRGPQSYYAWQCVLLRTILTPCPSPPAPSSPPSSSCSPASPVARYGAQGDETIHGHPALPGDSVLLQRSRPGPTGRLAHQSAPCCLAECGTSSVWEETMP